MPAAEPGPATLEPAPSGARTPAPGTPVPAPAAPEVPTRPLELTVRTARGIPVEGATVYVEDTDPVARGVRTDAGGRASLVAPAADGWVLVRTQEGVWGRAPFAPATTEVGVTIPIEPVLRGRVLDPWGRPAAGVRIELRGAGRENPARAWPATRRWEMRREVGEAVTDASGRFELAGLADLAEGFLVSSPDGEVHGLDGYSAALDPSAVRRFELGRYVRVLVEVRDDVTDGPVLRASIAPEPDPAVRGVRVEEGERESVFSIRWAVPESRVAPAVRVEVTAPGFAPQVVTLGPLEAARPSAAPAPDPVVVRMVRGPGVRAGMFRLRMPSGVWSPIPRSLGSLSYRADNGRGYGTTGRLVNRGAYWVVENAGGAGGWRLPDVFGLHPPALVTGVQGEVVDVDLTGPAWGHVVLRLTGEADLWRGEFEAAADGGSAFRVTADETGRADAGWWPPRSYRFRVRRSAEEGVSDAVEVREGPEPTVVEIPVRNLLGR